MDAQHYLRVYKAIGEAILVNTCSSALFIICKSPIYRRSKRYWDSYESLQFIQGGGLAHIASSYMLDINPDRLQDDFFEQAYYLKDENSGL